MGSGHHSSIRADVCPTLSMHTCSMRTIWPSFARKRAQQQQPKTQAFSQYVYHAGRTAATARCAVRRRLVSALQEKPARSGANSISTEKF